MSRSTNSTFTCPCGTVFTSPIYEYVNVAQDLRLRYTALSGLLNVSTCPNCGRRSALAHPFIYSDPDHKLLAYVHPSTAVPEEARQLILEKLRAVYEEAEATSYAGGSHQEINSRGKGSKQGKGSNTDTRSRDDLPDLHVIFGIDQLHELINSVLSQDERLGRLAFSTQSRSDAERGRMLDIARKFAAEMQCQVDVEDLPDEYTVWLYGSRRQIGAIMRELNR
ncbi:MAG: CpXC domain-containing protein [Ktedonobacteraceae bacterium]